jgi:exodeoxyribonuclease VII large subunit
MMQIAARRWPAAELVLEPVRVQGAGAAEEIAAAIRKFSDAANVDLIVAGRGGGSLEDLWAFNEELVARAIFESELPVVSAVGHEVDFTIADLVADLRAPTPSAAMELVLPDRHAVAARVLEFSNRLRRSMRESLRGSRAELQALSSHWALREPLNLIRAAAQRTDDLQSRLVAAHTRVLRDKRISLSRIQELMVAFHPHQTLARGYAIVRAADGTILRDSAATAAGSELRISFARGGVSAEVTGIDREEQA